MQINVEPGGEKYVSWAKKQLKRLEAFRLDLNLPVMRKFWRVAGSLIAIESSEFGDRIRITGGTAFMYQIIRVSSGDKHARVMARDSSVLSTQGLSMTPPLTIPRSGQAGSFLSPPYIQAPVSKDMKAFWACTNVGDEYTTLFNTEANPGETHVLVKDAAVVATPTIGGYTDGSGGMGALVRADGKAAMFMITDSINQGIDPTKVEVFRLNETLSPTAWEQQLFNFTTAIPAVADLPAGIGTIGTVLGSPYTLFDLPDFPGSTFRSFIYYDASSGDHYNGAPVLEVVYVYVDGYSYDGISQATLSLVSRRIRYQFRTLASGIVGHTSLGEFVLLADDTATATYLSTGGDVDFLPTATNIVDCIVGSEVFHPSNNGEGFTSMQGHTVHKIRSFINTAGVAESRPNILIDGVAVVGYGTSLLPSSYDVYSIKPPADSTDGPRFLFSTKASEVATPVTYLYKNNTATALSSLHSEFPSWDEATASYEFIMTRDGKYLVCYVALTATTFKVIVVDLDTGDYTELVDNDTESDDRDNLIMATKVDWDVPGMFYGVRRGVAASGAQLYFIDGVPATVGEVVAYLNAGGDPDSVSFGREFPAEPPVIFPYTIGRSAETGALTITKGSEITWPNGAGDATVSPLIMLSQIDE